MDSVLVVDDDLTLGRSIETELIRRGFEVKVVDTTFAALDLLDVRKFTVVLADIAMPSGMPNGLSLARMVRVRDPQCRVILMTGYADLATEGDLFGAKVLVKPVDLDVLTDAIREEIAASMAGGPE